jgi:hypothetical protein
MSKFDCAFSTLAFLVLAVIFLTVILGSSMRAAEYTEKNIIKTIGVSALLATGMWFMSCVTDKDLRYDYSGIDDGDRITSNYARPKAYY